MTAAAIAAVALAEQRVDDVIEICDIVPADFPVPANIAYCLLRSAYGHGYTDGLSEGSEPSLARAIAAAMHARLPVDP